MSEPVSFATFEKVRAERDRLADRSARDRELLVMMTVERDRLRALVREVMPTMKTVVHIVRTAGYDHQAIAISAGWIDRARALLGEVE